MNLIYQVHRTVLVLATFCEAFFLRRLQPKKDRVKACRGHQSHEFLILGEVHRGFSVQYKWKTFGLLPGFEFPKERFDLRSIPDEIVVYDEEAPTPTHVEQYLKLPYHLVIRFYPGTPAIQVDDVTKLTVVRASPGILNRH